MPVHDWLKNKLLDSMSTAATTSSSITANNNSSSSSKKMLSRKRRGGGGGTSNNMSSAYSIGEDAPMDASWRVENIRTQGCPSEADWWKRDDNSITEKDEQHNDDSDEKIKEKESDEPPKFHNCGLETWEAAREKWRETTVKEKPAHPPPVRYDEVVRGLTQVVRTYELPGRMTLPDIVDVFVDIWECEKDY